MTTDTTAADLTAIRDQIRAELTEARGTLKDLRYEIKQARQTRTEIEREVQAAREAARLIVTERLEAEVTEQVAALGKTTAKAMRDSVERVNAKFDELYDLLTGQTAEDRAKNHTPLPELIKQYVARHATKDGS